jgi:hypothetical protein
VFEGLARILHVVHERAIDPKHTLWIFSSLNDGDVILATGPSIDII